MTRKKHEIKVKSKIEGYVEEAITNIRSDRGLAMYFLNEIKNIVVKKEDSATNYRNHGPNIVKLLETMQRSNEQLVKICSNVLKPSSIEAVDLEFTDEEEENLYDEIKSAKEE